MAAFLLPSWQLDFSGPREKALTVHEIRQKKRLSVKRKVKRKVKFAHQLHRLIKVFLPSPSRSKPTTQVRGSLQYRSPSPFPRGRIAEEVDEIKEQPEGDVLDAPPRPASRTSDASTSMWGIPISYLDGARQSRSPSRPASQDVQARHEVKVTTPPTLEARPQTAAIEQMRKSYPSFAVTGRFVFWIIKHSHIFHFSSVKYGQRQDTPPRRHHYSQGGHCQRRGRRYGYC